MMTSCADSKMTGSLERYSGTWNRFCRAIFGKGKEALAGRSGTTAKSADAPLAEKRTALRVRRWRASATSGRLVDAPHRPARPSWRAASPPANRTASRFGNTALAAPARRQGPTCARTPSPLFSPGLRLPGGGHGTDFEARNRLFAGTFCHSVADRRVGRAQQLSVLERTRLLRRVHPAGLLRRRQSDRRPQQASRPPLSTTDAFGSPLWRVGPTPERCYHSSRQRCGAAIIACAPSPVRPAFDGGKDGRDARGRWPLSR